MKSLWVWLLMAASCGGAQGGSSVGVRDFPAYKVYPGTLDEGGFPLSNARLCTVEAKDQCFTLAHSGAGSDEDSWTYYGLRARSRRIKLDGGGSVVLFNANTGGGSGSSDRYVLLRSDADGRLKNLLPEIIVTNQADVAMLGLPTVSSLPVLLTADALWEGQEGHYGSHFFEIRMYVYDSGKDRYKLSHKYSTASKYPGIDNWDQTPEVLEKERKRIVAVLGAK
jgi:hypothetical protein